MTRFEYLMKFGKPKEEIHWQSKFQGKKVYCYWRVNAVDSFGKEITFGMFDGLMGRPTTKCLVVNTMTYFPLKER